MSLTRAIEEDSNKSCLQCFGYDCCGPHEGGFEAVKSGQPTRIKCLLLGMMVPIEQAKTCDQFAAETAESNMVLQPAA